MVCAVVGEQVRGSWGAGQGLEAGWSLGGRAEGAGWGVGRGGLGSRGGLIVVVSSSPTVRGERREDKGQQHSVTALNRAR